MCGSVAAPPAIAAVNSALTMWLHDTLIDSEPAGYEHESCAILYQIPNEAISLI